MNFQDSDYKVVESVLFDNGGCFNELQKQFIELFETKTIVAGPGAGKTTALVAKICLLIKKLKENKSNEGICIITHTNVAINEINNTLLKCGVGKIEHPHFIGTIHEFFNRFCVYPYFRINYSKATLMIDKFHSSDIAYYRSFLKRNYSWMQEEVIEAIAKRTNRCLLFWNEETKKIDLLNNESWDRFDNHKEKMLRAKISRKALGIITHDDTFLFSKALLCEERIRDIIQKRFKYIFLDEFQDTSNQGIDLLDKLFNTTNHIFQKIGDPFQTISYQHSMPEIMEENIFRINLTNRFGSEIGNCLNTIIPDARIESTEFNKSFKPILLIFENVNEIYTSFNEIISGYEQNSEGFKKSNKKDKILIEQKRWVSAFVEEGEYREKKSKLNKSKVIKLKESIFDFILKRIVDEKNEEIASVAEWLGNHKEVPNLYKVLIEVLKKGFTDECKQQLVYLINLFLVEKQVTLLASNNKLFKDIQALISGLGQPIQENKVLDKIFTIHSVKGETLRSVLLLDFETKNITESLRSSYDVKNTNEISIIHRNLLYVAISRVTHLFVFAVNKEDIQNLNIQEMQKHWNIVDISSKKMIGV